MISQEKILEMIKNDNIITQTVKFHGKEVKKFHWLIDEENKQHFVIEFDMIENDRFLTIFIKDNTFDFTLDYTIENNKINKNILKKLQNLSYINIRETPNLDNIDILYIDGDNERYQLLSKEVKYIINFVSNWEVFDFDNLQKSLDEMKELQQKMKQNYDPHEGE